MGFDRIAKLIRTIGMVLFNLILFFLFIEYIQVNIYSYPTPHPFTGNTFYNPYQNEDVSNWIKANFHAHSNHWKGIFNGNQSEDEIVKKYHEMGYDLACISDYESYSSKEFLPVYEHGFNISKTHQLVFAPHCVNYFDLPFYQNIDTKQSVLASLSGQDEMVSLNHPQLWSGYTDDDLKKLQGYNTLEIATHSGVFTHAWDIALSSGHPAWLMANDDIHDLNRTDHVGVCWNLVKPDTSSKNLLDDLKTGKSIGFIGHGGIQDPIFKSLSVVSNTYQLNLNYPASTISLIGQDGKELKTVFDVSQLTYKLLPTDTYARAEITTDKSKIYLNPVIRYHNSLNLINSFTVKINVLKTVLLKGSIGLLYILIFWLMNRVWILKRGNPNKNLLLAGKK